MSSWTRRRFLKATGLTMALPLLEADAKGEENLPVYSVFVRHGNGVTQGDSNGESDRFWPLQTGPLTPMGLADQSTAVLRALDKLAKIGPDKDIPHITRGIIAKYVSDLRLLGLLDR